jgi:tRNA (guanine37-N1)-methyltransferase
VDVRLWALRDFADGNYRRVDDRPFGGGPGMVMMAEPLARCLQAMRASGPTGPVVLFSPVGRALDHAAVTQWSASAGAVLVCGRYEGIDQRFIDTHVDMQISLGDFVLSGGEIAAMALLDAVARLQPGVLNDEGSHQLDSFNPALDGLLDCPHYTRPEVWHGQPVPAVLLSGHHAQIERWRRDRRLEYHGATAPICWPQARQAGRLSPGDEAVLAKPAKIVYNQRLFDPLSGRPPQRVALRTGP